MLVLLVWFLYNTDQPGPSLTLEQQRQQRFTAGPMAAGLGKSFSRLGVPVCNPTSTKVCVGVFDPYSWEYSESASLWD